LPQTYKWPLCPAKKMLVRPVIYLAAFWKMFLSLCTRTVVTVHVFITVHVRMFAVLAKKYT